MKNSLTGAFRGIHGAPLGRCGCCGGSYQGGEMEVGRLYVPPRGTLRRRLGGIIRARRAASRTLTVASDVDGPLPAAKGARERHENGGDGALEWNRRNGFCRSGLPCWIRTSGLLVPSEARYQAAPMAVRDKVRQEEQLPLDDGSHSSQDLADKLKWWGSGELNPDCALIRRETGYKSVVLTIERLPLRLCAEGGCAPAVPRRV